MMQCISISLAEKNFKTGYSEVLREGKIKEAPNWTRSSTQIPWLWRGSIYAPIIVKLRFLTREEQNIFDRALSRSVKMIARGRRK